MDNGMETEKNRLAVIMKYSIITINYNNKKGLLNTLKSVVGQSYHDYEYIVIDGGSTDGSVEVIREYESHIDYWISEPDKGIYNAMNKGILQAHGEYLNFMNSGDEFYDSDVLLEVSNALDCDIVVGRMQHDKEIWSFPKEKITMLDLVQGTVLHQASFFCKKLFDENKYDEKYKIVSDWKFYIQSLILKNVSFRNLDIMICKFTPGGISEVDIELKRKERSEVYKELFPDRVMEDYFRFAKADSILLELTPYLNRTNRLNRLAYCMVLLLIKINDFFLSVRQFIKKCIYCE